MAGGKGGDGGPGGRGASGAGGPSYGIVTRAAAVANVGASVDLVASAGGLGATGAPDGDSKSFLNLP